MTPMAHDHGATAPARPVWAVVPASSVPVGHRAGTGLAAAEANARGEYDMQYNARKEQVVEIYHRAFVAAGMLEK
jgi:hypothetical protein